MTEGSEGYRVHMSKQSQVGFSDSMTGTGHYLDEDVSIVLLFIKMSKFLT
jgi:hypothetical protein